MAKGFLGAKVLHQKSAGHCSLAAASLCTARVVRDYFRNGTLPEEGKECEVESRMFGGPVDAEATSQLGEEDEVLMRAMKELSQNWETPMLHM